MNLTRPRTFTEESLWTGCDSWPELEIRREERRRIGRELHDSTSQLLVAIQLNLASLRQNSENNETRLLFSVLDSTLQELHSEVRAIASTRDAPAPHIEDLPGSLQTMAAKFGQRTNIDIKVDVQGRYVPGSPEVATCLYRIAQEALANVARHAAARGVRLCLRCRKTLLKLTIEDDGVGFASDANAAARHDEGNGLANIRQRVAELKGRLSLERLPQGSRLSVTLGRLPAPRASA
jgi:Signal transduction histidine kinase